MRSGGVPSGVSVVNLAGEPLSLQLVEQVYQFPAVKKVYNLYGPTEDTTYSTFALTHREDPRPPTIGRPVANTRIYLLDALLRLVPEGVIGELFIAGDGLARGYIERPGQTADRFLPDPFGARGGRMYRTGDLARYRADGSLEYLGRSDHQVKLRGFRIELGEIEYLLGCHPGVGEAVVVIGDSVQGKRLVAYLVPRGGAVPETGELRAYLREMLPEHMVPSAFVTLQHLPVTPNGKVDRRALPAPDPAVQEPGRPAAPPATPIEQMLAGIWEQVLHVRNVRLHDNFFQLGGHSLLAMQVISRVRDAFRLELPVTTLFSAPTLAAFAECLENATHFDAPALVQPAPAPRGETVPASYAQHRLWLLQHLQPESPFLNMTAGIRLKGRLQHDAVIRAFGEIVRRHESLRTRFELVGGQLVQRILPHSEVPVETVDLSLLVESEREAKVRDLAQQEAMRPLDVSAGLLLRVTLARLHDDDHVLLISMHHIASDGWSVGVFTRELALLYSAFAANQASPLEELPLQYADYAVWQRDALKGEMLDRLVSYWRRQLDGAPGTLRLPLDRPRPAAPSFKGASHRFFIPAKTAELVREICRREGATLFMALLSVLEIVLQYETGQDDIVVGTDIANRQHSQTEGLIGLFINELVLRVKVPGNPLFRDLLRAVRRTTLEAYAHQDMPFDRLVVALRPQRDPGVQPLFQIAFGLRNTPIAPLTLAGLSVESFPVRHEVCVHDLGVYISEAVHGLSGEIIYNIDIFDANTMARLAEHLQAVVEQVAETPEVRLEVLKQKLADFDAQKHTQRELALAKASRERLRRVKTASVAGH
jgi:acyl carrier protein